MNKKEIVFLATTFIFSIISFIFFDSVIADNIKLIRTETLNIIMNFFSNFFVIFIIFLVFIYVLVKKGKDYLAGLLYTLITFVFVYILKFIFARPRPLDGIYSFPSAHTAFTFSIASIIGIEIKETKIYFIIFMIYAIIVSFSRIYFNAHYLSDVLAGIFIGYLTPYIIKYLIERK